MQTSAPNSMKFRRVFAWICLGIILAILGYQLSSLNIVSEFLVNDFSAFWTTGRIIITGQNPYAPEKLRLLFQKEVPWKLGPFERTWNPPWSLTFIIPFGSLSYSFAAKLWLITHLLLILFCADWIWRFYGGALTIRWVAWIIGLSSYPALYVLNRGQISAIVLLGVIGFLHFIGKKKNLIAGIFIFLATIKPNLLFLFWFALLLWVMEHRRWSVLLGMGLAVLISLVFPLWLNPAVMAQYLYTAPNTPNFLFDAAAPTLATALRLWVAPEKIWLKFIPPVVGTLWLFLYWAKHHRKWEWREDMPLLLLMSLVTATYAWEYDQVVFLLPIIQVTHWLFQHEGNWKGLAVVTCYVGINCVAFSLPFIFPMINAFWYFWMPSAFLLWYWMAIRVFSRLGNR
jgi:hypothetical protein